MSKAIGEIENSEIRYRKKKKEMKKGRKAKEENTFVFSFPFLLKNKLKPA